MVYKVSDTCMDAMFYFCSLHFLACSYLTLIQSTLNTRWHQCFASKVNEQSLAQFISHQLHSTKFFLVDGSSNDHSPQVKSLDCLLSRPDLSLTLFPSGVSDMHPMHHYSKEIGSAPPFHHFCPQNYKLCVFNQCLITTWTRTICKGV